jgi:tetratricopeptide (TPR) repeat protein
MDNTFGKAGFFSGKMKIIAIAVAVVVVIVIVAVIIVQKGNKNEAVASDNLSKAYANFSVGNQDAGLAILNDLVANYSKTPAAYQARLFLGDYYTSIQNYNDALTVLTDTKNDAEPATIRPLALARIINIWDIRGEWVNAKDASEEFVKKYPDNFLTKSVYLSLARYYALLGDAANVQRVCNEILTKYPGSEEATIADNTLRALATAAPAPAAQAPAAAA